MFARHDWGGIFWATMLPICWALAPVLALVSQAQARMSGSVGDKGFQSTLFMSVFLAMFGLLAVRMLIGRALDYDHKRQAYLLAAFSLTCSVALIAYGMSAMD
jgi:predicted neutral ceramidase superfamily lipid hydrolase